MKFIRATVRRSPLALLTLLVGFWPNSALAPGPSALSNVNIIDSYLCNYARVKDHTENGDYVTVYSGPGPEYSGPGQFEKIDRLHSGKEVYTCDGRGDWLQVFSVVQMDHAVLRPARG